MDIEEIRHKQSFIKLLKIEIGECYKRIDRYKSAEMEVFQSFDKFIQTENQKIVDYETMIRVLSE